MYSTRIFFLNLDEWRNSVCKDEEEKAKMTLREKNNIFTDI